MLQTAVEMVNPGGTGRPALVISASPAPFPPKSSFMVRLPSALPLPKKNTWRAAAALLVDVDDDLFEVVDDFLAAGLDGPGFERAFFDMSALLNGCILRRNLGNIGDRQN